MVASLGPGGQCQVKTQAVLPRSPSRVGQWAPGEEEDEGEEEESSRQLKRKLLSRLGPPTKSLVDGQLREWWNFWDPILGTIMATISTTSTIVSTNRS